MVITRGDSEEVNLPQVEVEDPRGIRPEEELGCFSFTNKSTQQFWGRLRLL
jgi:hypothetical protein